METFPGRKEFQEGRKEDILGRKGGRYFSGRKVEISARREGRKDGERKEGT